MSGQSIMCLMKYFKAFVRLLSILCKKNKFTIFFIVCLLITFFLTLFLFPLSEKIDLSNGGHIDSPIMVSSIVDQRFNFRTLVSDFIQVPLGLAWYKVYIDNTSVRYDRDCFKYGPGQPFLWIYFKDASSPNKYVPSKGFLVEASSSTDSVYPVSVPVNGLQQYFVPYESSATFLYKGDSPLHFRLSAAPWFKEVIRRDGKCAQIVADAFDFTGSKNRFKEVNYAIYATPYLGAWIVKFIIIFLICFSLGANFISVWDWRSKG